MEGSAMYVDGTNYPKAAVPLPQAQKIHGPEAPHGGERAPREHHPGALPHDSFEHVSEVGPKAVTYSDDAAAHGPQADLGAPLTSAHASLIASYTAEIIDLETVVNARGLPVQPETANTGALTQNILNAQKAAPEPGSIYLADHLDRLG